MSVFEVVKKVIMEIKDVPEDMVTMDASFETDLEADSLDIVEMLMLLEEKYELSVPEDQLDALKTVRDVVEYFESRVGQQTN